MKIKIERKRLPLEQIQLNSGQIEGVPANPRQWTLTDVEKLAASLKETPELLEMRCPIVVPVGDAYITLGGNLRLAAAQYNKETELDCFVVEGATPRKMKEIAIKDNGSFGKWDFDSLANEWDDLPLNDWGLEVWQPMDEQTEKEDETEGGYNENMDKYTQKVDGIIYEPRGEKPSIEECVSLDTVRELTEKIDRAPIPYDLKEVLKITACRFAKIDFSKIAEFYAQSEKTIQELMEDQCLVVIDFGDAVKKGLAHLDEKIVKLYTDVENED